MSPEPDAGPEFQALAGPAPAGSRARRTSSPVALAALSAILAILPYVLVNVRFHLGAEHGVTGTAGGIAFVYDDHGSIAENPFLHRPGAWHAVLGLRTFVDPHVIDGQRPVVILSYLMDKALWGLSPAGFHLTNLLLHAACVALVFLLSSGLSASPRFRVSASLLFGLHPVLTETVQVPAFREDLLAALFVLTFLVLAVRGRRWPALAALALALCSKETAVVAPALLVWWWLCFRGTEGGLPAPGHGTFTRPVRERTILLAAAAALVAVYLVVTFAHRPLQAAGQAWNGLALRWPDNVTTAPWLFALSLRRLIVPHPLCADYVVASADLAAFRFHAGLATLALAVVAAWRLRRRAPIAAFGTGWLLINFLPVSNLVPLFNPIADRYLYLPAAGFALVLACALERVIATRAGVGPARRAALPLAVVCAAYAALSVSRLADWRDDETLWRATARTEPRSARAQTWLGLLAAGKGDEAEARRRYEEADRLNPHNVHALINLAVLDGQAGRVDEAERKLRIAVERRPDFPDGWWNLAAALNIQGRALEAQSVARRAAALDPLSPRAAPFK